MTAGHEDPISAASAGLRALGVAPQRRVETLGLLSALLDLADDRGEVLLDSALIETEERLGIDACLEGYEWLERLGVIERTWSGWMIPDFDAHHGPVGMTEASMAVLQRHLAANEDAPVVTLPVAAAVPVADAAPVVVLRPWRRRLPAIAASVAAGVAVLAGATQFTPQAAVSHRDAAVRTEGTASALADALTPEPTTSNGAGTAAATSAAAAPASEVTTTTTSTTLLPTLPCLNQTINDLTGRSGLNLSRDSSGVLPPGVLPCP